MFFDFKLCNLNFFLFKLIFFKVERIIFFVLVYDRGLFVCFNLKEVVFFKYVICLKIYLFEEFFILVNFKYFFKKYIGYVLVFVFVI